MIWQYLDWFPAYSSDDFWYFCSNFSNIDAAENVTEVDYILSNYTAGEPWTNLGNYANYIKNVILPICPPGEDINSSACSSTQNGLYSLNIVVNLELTVEKRRFGLIQRTTRPAHMYILVCHLMLIEGILNANEHLQLVLSRAYTKLRLRLGPQLVSSVLQVDYMWVKEMKLLFYFTNKSF
jgi:hypothetical protein